jgi:thiol-disulfide isomerase/thioredoxin
MLLTICQPLFRGWSRLSMLSISVLLWALCASVGAQELTPWHGASAPALALADHRGQPHTLTAYHGQVVLVNFWATWCEPCREEMPALQHLQNLLGKERFVVLAVNYGEAPERVQAFVRTVPVDFSLLLDRHGDVTKTWQVQVLPTSFVVGPDGTIRYRVVGVLDWGDAAIVKQLAGLLTRP